MAPPPVAPTAVKIAPNYEGPVVYVPDALTLGLGCAVGPIAPETREQYIQELETDYERVRTLHAHKKQRRC